MYKESYKKLVLRNVSYINFSILKFTQKNSRLIRDKYTTIVLQCCKKIDEYVN